MIKYLSLSITFCFLFHYQTATAQQPSYAYTFKLLDAHGKSITDADSLFSVSSIKPDGSFYSKIGYGNPNGRGKILGSESWWLYEYHTDIREFHFIQIVNRRSRDTMMLFYKKYLPSNTYAGDDNMPALDTIRFSKGYYFIHKRPMLKDWDMKSKSKSLVVFANRDDFLSYVTIEINGAKSDTAQGSRYTSRYDEIEPSPIPLSRFKNLVLPVYSGEKAGRIVVRFFADKDGRVTDAIPGVKGTTLGDKILNQKCKEAMMKSSLLQSEKPIQSGTVKSKNI